MASQAAAPSSDSGNVQVPGTAMGHLLDPTDEGNPYEEPLEDTTDDNNQYAVDEDEPDPDEAPDVDEGSADKSEENRASADGKKADRLEATMRKIAEETGLDLEKNQDALRKFAERELQNSNTGEEGDESGKKSSTTDDGDHLTPFEKQLAEAGDEKPQDADSEKAKPADGETSAPQETILDTDIGKDWQSLDDAHRALNEAWDSGDLKKVSEVDLAMHRRKFFGHDMQFIEKYVNQRLDQAFKDNGLSEVVAERQQRKQEQISGKAAEFARSELSKTGLKDSMKELFTEDDGDPVIYEGKEYKKTPFNRLMVEYPFLSEIKVEHKDPETAAKLTYLKRYREVAKLHSRLQKQGQVKASEAKELIDAGAKNTQRDLDKTTRVRQRLNSGGKQRQRPPEDAERYYTSGGGAIDQLFE